MERSQTHHTFVLEREFPAPVARVWSALSVDDERAQWWGDDGFTEDEKSHDFRVGGQLVEDGQWHNGPRSRFVSTYTDIVDLERIVYTYDMWVDDKHMSTSITTMSLEQTDAGTRLTFTEQGVHLDGLDSPEGRETGTAGILDTLGAYLTRSS